MTNKLSFIGVGRLGLATALTFEKHGYEILGYDINEKYLNHLKNKTLKTFEPGVENMLKNSTKFNVTSDFNKLLEFSDIIFIFVNTPTSPDGYDCSILSSVLHQINTFKVKGKTIVIGSTVLPGYSDNIGTFMLNDCEDTHLVYNPEFIAQGTIIKDLVNPDILLIGSNNENSLNKVKEIYIKCGHDGHKFKMMSIKSAEITKLATNCFTTTKISYANMVGSIAQNSGLDENEISLIMDAIGSDSKIGHKCLKPGYGYGGVCLPRDNRALGLYARSVGIEPIICDATDKFNNILVELIGNSLIKKSLNNTIIFENVSYKPNVPIIEESHKLKVAKYVAENSSYDVVISDTQEVIDLVMQKYEKLFQYKLL